MGLKEKLRRLMHLAEHELFPIRLEDGATVRFHEDEFTECFLHETARTRRHYFGEDPGPPHPIIQALRKASDEELERVFAAHGLILEHLVGEDQVMRGERERTGSQVRESSPGVYE